MRSMVEGNGQSLQTVKARRLLMCPSTTLRQAQGGPSPPLGEEFASTAHFNPFRNEIKSTRRTSPTSPGCISPSTNGP
jgi:hypothetical protein